MKVNTMDNLENVEVVIGDGDSAVISSIGDFLEIDTSTLQENLGFANLPSGQFVTEVTEANIDTANITDKDTGESVVRPRVRMKFKILEVLAAKTPQEKWEGLVGKSHTESILIKNQEDLGKVVAITNRLGLTGALRAVLPETVGKQCKLEINSRVLPDGREFSNIKLDKIVLI